MNAADVSSSTRPLMSSSIAVSFRWIGQSPKAMLSARRRDDFCRSKQLRAERQPGGLGGLEIDTQPDLVLAEDEPDHAARTGEVITIGHCKDGTVFEGCENGIQPPAFGLADEQDMA